MDHLGGLQRVTRLRSSHPSVRNSAQLVVRERGDLAGNFLVARAELFQELRNLVTDLGHSRFS
jgi:hypothetical protein